MSSIFTSYWILVNNSVCLQWGNVSSNTSPSTVTTTVNYPTAFKYNAYPFVALSGAGDIYDLEAPTSISQFVYRVMDATGGNANASAYWFAIGY